MHDDSLLESVISAHKTGGGQALVKTGKLSHTHRRLEPSLKSLLQTVKSATKPYHLTRKMPEMQGHANLDDRSRFKLHNSILYFKTIFIQV